MRSGIRSHIQSSSRRIHERGESEGHNSETAVRAAHRRLPNEPVLPFRVLVEVVENQLAFGRSIVERLFG